MRDLPPTDCKRCTETRRENWPTTDGNPWLWAIYCPSHHLTALEG